MCATIRYNILRKSKRLKIGSKCNWHNLAEKSSKDFLNFEENIVQSKVIYILLLLTKMKLQIRLKQIRTHSWGKVVRTAFFIVIIILLLLFFRVHVLKMVMLGVSINFCTQCVIMTQIT